MREWRVQPLNLKGDGVLCVQQSEEMSDTGVGRALFG